jgi:RNA polymerase sigma factor (sigma-70 family)
MAVPLPPESPDRTSVPSPETLASLFKEHNRSLVSYLALRLHSLQEAKEVAQEAYVRLLQLDKPGAASFLKTYLFRVATNLAIDRLRRRSYRQQIQQTQLSADIDCGIDGPEQRLVADDALRMLDVCLEELPEKCRQAFVMFRMEGLSQEKIAARLGVTDRMVRHYVNQALLYCRLRIDGASEKEAKEGLHK